MKPRLLLNDTPVDELSEELFHTTAHLQAYPFLQPQTIQHEATIVDLNLLVQIEISLLRALMHAEARMVVVDGHIDILASAIDGTIRVENGRDRKSLVHQRYFNNVQPSRFKRPLLGEQLESMREWIPSLTAPQSSPTLQGYGTQLAERVVEADGTVRAEADARRNLAAHELGARKVFIDRLNAMRQALYGQLAELPHSRPDLSLPPDFAFRFFLRDARPRKQTITTLERDITRLQGKLQRAETELARLVEEAAAETRHYEDTELAEAEAELAELEQQRVEAAARIADLQARRTTPAV